MSTHAPSQPLSRDSCRANEPVSPGLLLRRNCAGGGTADSLDAECEPCRRKRLQSQLAVGSSNDPLEGDAERVADEVMDQPEGASPARVQRQAGSASAGMASAPASVDRALAAPGQPLEPALRQDMERRFGHDFARVRVHSGGAAEQSAREVSANAYTVGHDIVFAAGQFAPGTSRGRHLLAHELAHVVQQAKTSRDGGPATALVQRQTAATLDPTLSSSCTINFKQNTTEFTDKGKAFTRCMAKIRAFLEARPTDAKVQLFGFASEEGDVAFNQDLSQRRADIVKLLLGKGGIDRSRIETFGQGLDTTYSTREENRRVEVVQVESVDFPDQPIPAPKPKPKPKKPKGPSRKEEERAMVPGTRCRARAYNSPGWVSVRPIAAIKLGEAQELPHAIRVEVTAVKRKIREVDILEGRYQGKDVKIQAVNLELDRPKRAAAECKFDIGKGELHYGKKGPVAAKTDLKNPAPTGTHDLEIPDFQHNDAKRYGAYATTWFRVGHSGDRYLHPGGVTLGCVTVTEIAEWPSIWRYLINARKDDQSVGTLEVT